MGNWESAPVGLYRDYGLGVARGINRNRDEIKKDLKAGLVFLIDYNEERQMSMDDDFEVPQYKDFVQRIDESQDDEKAFIYLDTIGGIFLKIIIVLLRIYVIYRACEIDW